MALAWRDEASASQLGPRVWRDVRLALGSVAATPIRARATERRARGLEAHARDGRPGRRDARRRRSRPSTTSGRRPSTGGRSRHASSIGSSARRAAGDDRDRRRTRCPAPTRSSRPTPWRSWSDWSARSSRGGASCLAARAERRAALAAGGTLELLPETAEIREAEWVVASAPADLDDRRVEITGPAEPKMTINALNSGARVFMADLEDALSPTWANVVGGQVALRAAVAARAHVRRVPDGQGVPARRPDRDPARPAARLAPRRAAPAPRRLAAECQPRRLRAVVLPQRR